MALIQTKNKQWIEENIDSGVGSINNVYMHRIVIVGTNKSKSIMYQCLMQLYTLSNNTIDKDNLIETIGNGILSATGFGTSDDTTASNIVVSINLGTSITVASIDKNFNLITEEIDIVIVQDLITQIGG